MDEVRIPPAGDGFYAAAKHRDDDVVETHYASLERACCCYGGYHYLGHMEIGDDGEEVEVFAAVSCRRCNGKTQ